MSESVSGEIDLPRSGEKELAGSNHQEDAEHKDTRAPATAGDMDTVPSASSQQPEHVAELIAVDQRSGGAAAQADHTFERITIELSISTSAAAANAGGVRNDKDQDQAHNVAQGSASHVRAMPDALTAGPADDTIVVSKPVTNAEGTIDSITESTSPTKPITATATLATASGDQEGGTPPAGPPIQELELAPLPTTFDPDMEPPVPSSAGSQIAFNPFGIDASIGSLSGAQAEDDEDRLETGEGIMEDEGQPEDDALLAGEVEMGGEGEAGVRQEEEDEGMMMEYITSLQQFQPGEYEEEEEQEQVEVEHRDEGTSDAMHGTETDAPVDGDISKNGHSEEQRDRKGDESSLKEGERNGNTDAAMRSDIPELPDTLALSPLEPKSALAPESSAVSEIIVVENAPLPTLQDIPHAESSTSAAKRSASPSASSPKPTPSAAATNMSPSPSLPSTSNPRKRIRSTDTAHTRRSKDNRKSNGKGKEKEKVDGSVNAEEEVDELDEDSDVVDLREISDSEMMEERNTKGGKRASKKAKGSDGKPFKSSKKRLDAASGIKISDKPPEKIAPRPKSLTDGAIKKLLAGKTKEVQLAACQRPRYAKWGKCTQCIAKLGGDSCRFRDYRTFEIDPETTEIKAPGYFESTEWKEETTPLPTEFNRRLEEGHIIRTERTVAPMLLPLITGEIRHVVNSKAIKRGVDAAKHRSVCDFCSSTIFGGWFFCKKCGRDYCLLCERYFSDSLETITKSPWYLPDAAKPRLLRCHHQVPPGGRQPKGPAFHIRSDLQPVSRFDDEELRAHWLKLADFVLEEKDDMEIRLRLMGLKYDDEEVEKTLKEFPDLSVPPPEIDPALETSTDGTSTGTSKKIVYEYTKKTHATAIPIPDPARLEAESREFMFVSNDDLDNKVFDDMWSKGEPIVVRDVGKRLHLDWTPESFIERFGKEPCYVVDCQSNKPRLTNVGAFFEMFKNTEGRGTDILKLKDWPSTDDFQNTHPELYNDFCDALPIPDFTRREGVLNLYAHFPPGPTRPDIGPKMYNAFEAVETTGGFGSTRLHMDVADAVNLLTHASDRPDGEPGCAVWDLFRAEDADLIREFLRDKFEKTHSFTDPIHSQLFYLDASLRKELFESKGVKGWRVYQYPGQAVFIPAGCAHQVCNLADCIKIALDFVSPHNVRRCQKLTQDFRTENFVKAWKDDVLQLYNVLWYAWLSCQETRERRIREAKAEEVAAAARASHLASLRSGQHNAYESFSHQNHGHSHGRSRIGSPMTPSTPFGVSGWNVSSVRDEPHIGSRSPTVAGSRGTSPTPSASRKNIDEAVKDFDRESANGAAPEQDNTKDKGADRVEQGGEKVKGKEDAQDNGNTGMKDDDDDATAKKLEEAGKAKRKLAESLLAITLQRETPPPAETFVASPSMWAGKKGIVAPVPSVYPSAGGAYAHGRTAGTRASLRSSSALNPTNTLAQSQAEPAPNTSTAAGPSPDPSATATTVVTSAAQASYNPPSLTPRQQEQQRKEAERKALRIKNAPRELRTSTLIKLGAKRMDEILSLAQGQMMGGGEGMMGIGEEAWSGLARASPSPGPDSGSGADTDGDASGSGSGSDTAGVSGSDQQAHLQSQPPSQAEVDANADLARLREAAAQAQAHAHQLLHSRLHQHDHHGHTDEHVLDIGSPTTVDLHMDLDADMNMDVDMDMGMGMGMDVDPELRSALGMNFEQHHGDMEMEMEMDDEVRMSLASIRALEGDEQEQEEEEEREEVEDAGENNHGGGQAADDEVPHGYADADEGGRNEAEALEGQGEGEGEGEGYEDIRRLAGLLHEGGGGEEE
ncbi:hypothetical protein I317_01409 [Kwoniella heveanensis CBS 569]|nr:hypothetical protein I317_01409 [Kwoniella heveanensis CBS 569]